MSWEEQRVEALFEEIINEAVVQGLHIACYGEGCEDCDNGWINEEVDVGRQNKA